MFTFPILRLSFSNSILRSHISEKETLRIDGIQVLTGEFFPDSSGVLYIGTASVIYELSKQKKLSSVLLLAAGDSASLDALFASEEVSIFTCSLSLEAACSRAFSCCFEFNSWLNKLNTLSRCSKDIKELLDEGAARFKAPLFLLNGGYHLIASNVDHAFENVYIHQLLTDGYLSSESIDELASNNLRGFVNRQSDTFYESILDTGHYALLCLLKYRTNVFGRLLVISKYGADSAALRDYVKLFARVIQEHSLIYNREQFESDAEFSALVADLIERKVSGEEELKNRLFRLPALLQPPYHCILITFTQREDLVPIGRITHSLKKIFPLCNVAMYQDELIVLVGHSSHLSLPKDSRYDKEAFIKLLIRYDAYATIGNSTKFLASIRPTYLQCKTAVRLGRAMSGDAGQRVFSADDGMLPLLIDLCAQYGYDFHENNLIYLCTPKYTALKRHDIEQEDDLCTILGTYIRNNCNTSQTARELFLHRNTVINKLDRIEEIIGGTLTDWKLQCQLMLSAMIFDYAEKYRQEDLLQVKEKYALKPEQHENHT